MNMLTRRVLAAFLFVSLVSAAGATGRVEIPATRTVQDSLGRSVEIPDSPSRIIAAGRSVLMIADALYLFPGAAERIVGLGRIDQGKGNFLAALDPDYAEKLTFERNVGPEQIAAAQPDLVILKSQMKGPLGDQVEILGIPVVYVDLETPAQYERDLVLLGEVLGQPQRGGELARYYATRTREVELQVDTIPADERPDTLFLYADLTGGETVFSVPPVGWIQTQMTETAGGVPVWTDAATGGGWNRVTIEQIAAWDPDVVTLVAYRQDATAVLDRVLANPLAGSLRAARDGRVHLFPLDYYSWDQPDARWILGLTWLADTLHPQSIETDINREMREFFSFAYEMTDSQIDEIIVPVLEGIDTE
jgi:iron complex transport system substrate-binding protein